MKERYYNPTTLWVVTSHPKENHNIFVEKYYIAESFETFWWSFLQNLWKALFHADNNNTLKLLETFKEYVLEYIDNFIIPSWNYLEWCFYWERDCEAYMESNWANPKEELKELYNLE